jgi:predicted lysophospholipase L1 biosynthesis ABC-type transport system permease subunit
VRSIAAAPHTGAEIATATTRIVDELGRIVTLGVVMTMAVAGASLAVAVTGSLLDRRRPFALLRLSGVTLRTLRSILMLEAAGPLVAVAILSGLLGVAVSQLLLRLVGGGADVPLPDASFVMLMLASVVGALVVVAGTLPLVGPMTDLEETRFE